MSPISLLLCKLDILRHVNKVYYLLLLLLLLAHGLIQYIAILRKVKNSALRYCYLNAEKNTSLGAAGYVRWPKICKFIS